MIGGYIKNALSHPVIAASAGGLIGYQAMSGSLFGGLLAAGTIGTYLQARKMKRAKEAASAAAIAAAQACGDPNDPNCRAAGIAAAIAAGERAMRRPRFSFAMCAVLVGAALAIIALLK